MLDLTTLEFVGKEWQDVRTARNRVSGKPVPEMALTLGTVDHAPDPERRTHVAIEAASVVHGVTTWLPVYEFGEMAGWTMDLMRRRPDGSARSWNL